MRADGGSVVVVRCFGPLEIHAAAGRFGPRDLGGRKPKQLFEVLLLHRGRFVPKERIADELWGEVLPHNAGASLETYVSRLRGRLGDARDIVVTEPGGYRLDAAALDVDLDRFDALTADGSLEAVEEALALARGEVLEDEPYAGWACRVRDAYTEQVVATLVRAAELQLDNGDAATALAHARRAAALDKVRESAYRAEMRALDALGQTEQALVVHERCRGALAEELGVDPSPETLELHRRLLRAPATAPSPARRVVQTGGGERAELALLGRNREIGELERAAAAVLEEGGARLIVLHGEPGIGKSRLLAELEARLRSASLPAAIARATCAQLDATLPYAALASALRHLAHPGGLDAYPGLGEVLPELGQSALPPEAARMRALESVVALVRDVSPLLLIVDDLQWADPSTLEALSYLRRRGDGCAVAIVAAMRSGAAATSAGLDRFRPDVIVELGPLEPADLEPLGVPGLYERTGGNPLFCVECLASPDPADLPVSLRESILARCRAAGADAHRAIAIGSVLGTSFDLDVLAGVAGLGDAEAAETLERLRDEGLLVARDAGFAFRHDVIREVLATTLSPARLRALHAKAVSVLEARGGDPARLAVHAEQAGSAGPAVRYAIAAGDVARRRWANAEAGGSYETALRLAAEHPGVLDRPARDAVALRLARTLVSTGNPSRARELAEDALESARGRGDERAQFEALDVLGLVYQRGLSRPSLAVDAGREALEIASSSGASTLLGRAHMLLGAPKASLGLLDEAMDHYAEALRLAREAGEDEPAWAAGRMALALHHRAASADALRWCERAEAAALQQHDEETLLMSRWVRGLSLAARGEYARAWASLDSIAGIGKGEEVFWHSRFPNTYGSILADCCLWGRALERDLAGLEVAGDEGGAVREAWVQTTLNIAADHLALGDADAAAAALRRVREESGTIEYARFRWMCRLDVLDSELALSREDADEAVAAARRALAGAERYRLPKYRVRGHLALAGGLAASARAGRAAASADGALAGQAVAAARLAAGLADEIDHPALGWRAWWTAAALSGSADEVGRAQRLVLRCADGLSPEMREEFLAAVPVRP